MGKQSTKANRLSAFGVFLFYPARALMVWPFADSCELSYTKTKKILHYKKKVVVVEMMKSHLFLFA